MDKPTDLDYNKEGWNFPTRIQQSIERVQNNIQMLDRLAKKVQAWDSKTRAEKEAQLSNERIIGSLKLPITKKSISLTTAVAGVAADTKKEGTHETIYVNFKSRTVICRISGEFGSSFQYSSSQSRKLD